MMKTNFLSNINCIFDEFQESYTNLLSEIVLNIYQMSVNRFKILINMTKISNYYSLISLSSLIGTSDTKNK